MPSSWKCTTVRRRHCQTDRMRCRCIDFSRYYSCCATFTSLFAGHSELHLWANFLTMKLLLLLTLILCLLGPAGAQTTSAVVWQVNSFDINANVQQTERTVGAVATINATNVGTGPGRTLTVRLHAKATVKSVTIGGAATTFRPGAEPRGDLQ